MGQEGLHKGLRIEMGPQRMVKTQMAKTKGFQAEGGNEESGGLGHSEIQKYEYSAWNRVMACLTGEEPGMGLRKQGQGRGALKAKLVV